MFLNNNELDSVKIEISLKDLTNLQESAKLFFNVARERDSYLEEILKLREKIKSLESGNGKAGGNE